MANAFEIYKKAFSRGIRPDPPLKVSEWAEKYRKLSSKSTSESGPWRNSRTPFLVEIMDHLSPSSSVEEVIFKKGSQIGGTEAGNNWIGYVIDKAPGPMLFVMIDDGEVKKFSKQRLKPLINSTPAINKKIKESKKADGSDSLTMKDFEGGLLILAGAQDPDGLRSMPIRYVFFDEKDGYPDDCGGEGDPTELAWARTRTFRGKRKAYHVSTPTIAGQSRIEKDFLDSDQNFYQVPCPYCGKYQKIEWPRIKWPKSEPEKAALECISCEKLIPEHFKTKMLSKGKWIPDNPGYPDKKRKGFHLSALYSPLGWFSWADAAKQFLKAKGNPDKLKVFVNTVLGESWKEKGESPDWRRLYERRENYPEGTCPKGVLLLTAGVDVQKTRLEVGVRGWGRDMESWQIDVHVIEGDTSLDETWQELEKYLSRPFELESGGEAYIRATAVDSGYNTQMVYNWCRRFPGNRIMAVKGSSTQSRIVGHPTHVDINIKGKRIPRGLMLWPVGVDIAKQELYGVLNLEKPTDEEFLESGRFPPGFFHFPMLSEEFFKQLTAEELKKVKTKTGVKFIWEKVRDRNEALDFNIYARAAAAVIGIDRFDEKDWVRLESELYSTKPIERKSIKRARKKKRKAASNDDGFW